jgi:hypothetical protein
VHHVVAVAVPLPDTPSGSRSPRPAAGRPSAPAGLLPPVEPAVFGPDTRLRPAFARRRAVAGLGLLAAVTAGWLSVQVVTGALDAGSGSPPAPPGVGARPAGRVYVVQPGDTVWAIVRGTGVKGDPRPLVDRLQARLAGRPLEAGQQIVLP